MKVNDINETYEDEYNDDYEDMMTESWDIGEASRKQVEASLEEEERGKFYVRKSKGKVIISVKDDDKTRHIEVTEVGGQYTGDNTRYFDSIKQMIYFYQSNRIPSFNIILAQD